MTLDSFGYLGIRSDKLDEWSAYAPGLLGLELAERSGSRLRLRMDDRLQRIVVSSDPLAEDYFGWETRDSASLAELAGRLSQANVAVQPLDASECDARAIAELFVEPGHDGRREQPQVGGPGGRVRAHPQHLLVEALRTRVFGIGRSDQVGPAAQQVLQVDLPRPAAARDQLIEGLAQRIAEACLARARQFINDQMRNPHMFGPEAPAPEGASTIDQLAAFTGRTV